jgi:1-acyl-sn-glycerol-3-phosphate acyltransferase
MRHGSLPEAPLIPPVEGARRVSALDRRSHILFRLFGLYLRWYFYRSFHAVRIARDGLPPATAGRPLIVYSNHPSWWDPAVYILLCNKLFPERAGFGPMDSAALGKYRVLERMGVFGVPQDDPRGAAIFLRTSLAVLARPAAMLWITAEGEFTDHRSRPIVLRPGLAHLARRVPHAVIVPLALEYGFWNESRAEALIRFGAPVQPPAADGVAAWNARLTEALTETMDALAVQSMARNPGLFQPLVRGGAGIGGIYDLWRRARAVAAGQRFDPSHEGEP